MLRVRVKCFWSMAHSFKQETFFSYVDVPQIYLVEKSEVRTFQRLKNLFAFKFKPRASYSNKESFSTSY